MPGSFPPSSRATCLRVAEADATTRLPVAVEPVKLMWSIPGCDVSTGRVHTAVHSVEDSRGRRSRMCQNSEYLSGVNGDGFKTTVFPPEKSGSA